MIYYVLPSAGHFGGVKVAYQFMEALWRLGVQGAVASPNGEAASWFKTSIPVVSREQVLSTSTPDDILVFSLPDDYDAVAGRPGGMVFHCVGTDPVINRFLGDDRLVLLSGWPQGTAYLRRHSGREPVEVGIPVSDVFFYDGCHKRSDQVSYMARRGREICNRCRREGGHLHVAPIENVPSERGVAAILKASTYYLATAKGEWFGLPALEAMAAGCAVLSVPVVGGMDYLRHEENAILCEAEEMPERLRWLSRPEQTSLRGKLRDQGMATAYSYTMARHVRILARQLEGPLSFLRP